MTSASFEFITSDNGTFKILKWNSKCRASQRAHDRSLIRGVHGTHAASGLGSSLIPRYCVKVFLFIEYYAQFYPIPVPFPALQWFTIKLYLPTISDKSPWDTLRQIAFSLSFDTYAILLPSHHVKQPPLPPKQCCFVEKYLCGLKTTLIRGEEGGKDDFQKNQSIKPYKGEGVPTLLSEIVVSLLKM